jgi:hypothetical protein
MAITDAALTCFIQSFALHTATRNLPAIVEQFTDTFLAAGPAGAQCVRAADFALALPRRAELFASLDCEPAELIHVQPSPIDDRYALVHTTWRFTFRRDTGETDSVDSVSLFLVDTAGDVPRILAYISPQDILETIRRRGASA